MSAGCDAVHKEPLELLLDRLIWRAADGGSTLVSWEDLRRIRHEYMSACEALAADVRSPPDLGHPRPRETAAESLSVDTLVANLKRAIGLLRAGADRLYCDAIYDATSKQELLGVAWKIDSGKFGMDELEAHKAHSRQMAQHFALHDACNTIEAAMSADVRPEPPEETP